MVGLIIDTADTTTEKLTQLKNRGVTAIIRYDHRAANSFKQIHPAEARAIAAAGMQLGIVYEGPGATPSYFTKAHGVADASYSLQQAPLRGQPKGSAVYFAVDFDPTKTQIDDLIVPYFGGVEQVFAGEGYRVGAYCSGLCADRLRGIWPDMLIWLTCSLGFAGTRQALKDGDFDLFQGTFNPLAHGCDKTLAGLSVDFDSPKTNDHDWGAFVPWGEMSPVLPQHDVAWMQGVLKDKAGYTGALDGVVGPLTIAAMLTYVQMRELP
jgi:Rv2525c-like, glycoside hydrolase-like domain